MILAQTLLTQIEQAEQQADEIMQNAAREARDIIKSVEEANAAMERQATKEMRAQSQAKLEKAGEATKDEIKALELRRSTERAVLKRTAQQNISQASMAVFERVVNNGNR